MSASDRSSARTIGLKLIGSIAFSELCIMLGFQLFNVEAWMPPLLMSLADTLILSIVASFLIVFWVVNPMKIFEERRKAEEQIRFLAYYDSLTGLPNRNFFKELLGRSIEYARRYDRRFAVVMIDLDDFKKMDKWKWGQNGKWKWGHILFNLTTKGIMETLYLFLDFGELRLWKRLGSGLRLCK